MGDPGASRGRVKMVAMADPHVGSLVCGQFVKARLARQRFFVNNAPFFIIAKAGGNGQFRVLYQSEVSETGAWVPFRIYQRQIGPPGVETPLRITFFDWRDPQCAVPIGWLDTTLGTLCDLTGRTLEVAGPKGSVGTFVLASMRVMERCSFLECLRRGVRFGLMVAIDFTASNGPPLDPRSLHFAGDANPYEQCIRAVGEVLFDYEAEGAVSVVGFGGRVGGVVNHCFPLVFDSFNAAVDGVAGIISGYRHALGMVELSGPTLLSAVVRNAADQALAWWKSSRAYTVLLVMTDGVISDVAETREAIANAWRLPLSVVLVGLGDADFAALDVLLEPVPIPEGHAMYARSIVHFVPFHTHRSRSYTYLAFELLVDVPSQVCEWAEVSDDPP